MITIYLQQILVVQSIHILKSYNMKGNPTIEQTLDCMDQTIIKKVTTFPFKSTLLIVLGIALVGLDIELPPIFKQNLTPIIAIAALIVLFWGFILGLAEKVYYKYLTTGKKIVFTEILFERRDYEKITEMIDKQNFTNFNSLHKTIYNGVKLKIAYSEDMSLGFVQVLKYTPYEYAEKSQAKQLDKAKIEELLSSIKQ